VYKLDVNGLFVSSSPRSASKPFVLKILEKKRFKIKLKKTKNSIYILSIIGIRIFTKFDVLHLTQKFNFGKIQDKTK